MPDETNPTPALWPTAHQAIMAGQSPAIPGAVVGEVDEIEQFRACWDNDSVMHICGDYDRCEELDPRPTDAEPTWKAAKPRLRLVTPPTDAEER